MTQVNTAAAKTFGSIAFANGIQCSPCLDAEIMNMIAGRQIGDKRTTKELAAWIAGWNESNIAAK